MYLKGRPLYYSEGPNKLYFETIKVEQSIYTQINTISDNMQTRDIKFKLYHRNNNIIQFKQCFKTTGFVVWKMLF